MVEVTDAELDRLVRYLQTAPSLAARNAAAAITALRARIAELTSRPTDPKLIGTNAQNMLRKRT